MTRVATNTVAHLQSGQFSDGVRAGGAGVASALSAASPSMRQIFTTNP